MHQNILIYLIPSCEESVFYVSKTNGFLHMQANSSGYLIYVSLFPYIRLSFMTNTFPLSVTIVVWAL